MDKRVTDFVTWAFQGIISGCVIYGVAVLTDMKKSIEQLNVQVAIVLERNTAQQKELDRLEDRIDKMEQKKSAKVNYGESGLDSSHL